MIRRRVGLWVVLAAVLVSTSVVPAFAHSADGTYTASDGCKFDWVDVDRYSPPMYAADMRERGGNTCTYVRAKIHVKEGSWVTRQDTDNSHAYVRGYGATDMAWVAHNWKKNGVWKGWRKYH